MTNKPLYTGSEWTLDLLETIWEQIDIIAKEYKLDYYKPSIEIVSFDQMITNCSTSAMPSLFDHWTFGKDEILTLNEYKRTGSGLAFEVVINTDPAIAYCQENNSATMQTLVMAHAICGHSSFFKNNYMFKQFTKADEILGFITRYKEFLQDCETKYGANKVEYTLDACMTLQLHSFDTAPVKVLTEEELEAMRLDRVLYNEGRDASLDSTLPGHMELGVKDDNLQDMSSYVPRENILKLIGDKSPKLTDWQKRIVLGFCHIQQYFYPQYLTKIMNEGWASFWHYTILQTMHHRGLLSNASWLEVIDSHSMVLNQRAFSRMNPYTLGFNIFADIKRMSENPDAEDKKLFPNVAGKPWLENLNFAMKNYNDSSFIMQYLSPKVVQKMGLMHLGKTEITNLRMGTLSKKVRATADEVDLDIIRETLAKSCEMDFIRPRIVANVQKQNHVPTLNLGIPLYADKGDLNKALEFLWGSNYFVTTISQ